MMEQGKIDELASDIRNHEIMILTEALPKAVTENGTVHWEFLARYVARLAASHLVLREANVIEEAEAIVKALEKRNPLQDDLKEDEEYEGDVVMEQSPREEKDV